MGRKYNQVRTNWKLLINILSCVWHIGPDYVIGAKYATGKDPIKLYFTPTPGHYEALQEKQACK